LAAIVAFGPSFVYGLIAAMGRKQPMHGAFAVEVIHTIERRVATPLSVLVPLLGAALIFTGDHDLWASEWLIVSIGLYMAAFFFAIFWMTPRVTRMSGLLHGMSAAPVQEGPPAPPPEVGALARQIQMGGMALALAVIAIVVLMVWKPGAAYTI
ncbi:MAG: DUF2269 family protein, partial [Actinobacteria bacterium]|nr:DUF2269 family protein [Actinomycetota bacterium]